MYRNKRVRASNIRQRDFKGFAVPSGSYGQKRDMLRGEKNISRQQRYAGGKKRETRSTQACPCVTMRIMPVGVSTLTHASMQISKTTSSPKPRLYVDDVTGDAHARISIRVDRYPPSAARLLKVRSHARCHRGPLGDYDIWDNAVAQIGERKDDTASRTRALRERCKRMTELTQD